jgi:hypothetical protein
MVLYFFYDGISDDLFTAAQMESKIIQQCWIWCLQQWFNKLTGKNNEKSYCELFNLILRKFLKTLQDWNARVNQGVSIWLF